MLAGIRTIGGAADVDVVASCLVIALDDVPGEAWRRAKFFLRDPVPEKVLGLSLTVVLLSVFLRGRPRFLVGLAVASASDSWGSGAGKSGS